jgi:hypothetical protein
MCRCGKFAQAVMLATNELESVALIIYANQKQMRQYDPMLHYMNIVSEQAEAESPITPTQVCERP